ncbi:hypothetical protein [Stenotrophomonas sp. SY1]|uniref:hypothetical protein n=1 Tax=Stenotrophomonas sp. SY1 TaxID=477235 RepID=UPI001E343597|nr:hypothetical protein [Stenotrophomonas sp. SY1]MCD9086647.1 hypothetical protein [Stenotrophomonas sp. SY1]
MEEFARFALFQSLLVLLGFLHVPLMNDPLVLGRGGRGTALMDSLVFTVRVFAPLSVSGSLVLSMMGVAGPVESILLLAPSVMLACLCWSARSALHGDGNHRAACLVSTTGMLTSLLVFAGLLFAGIQPVRAAFMAIAGSSLLALLVATRFDIENSIRRGSVDEGADAALPGLAAAGLVWVSGNVTVLFLAWLGRLEDIAGLRAVLTLLLPLNQLLIGLSAFLMPRFAYLHGSGQFSLIQRFLLRLSLGCSGMALLFVLCVYPLAGQLLGRIYGTGYVAYEGPMRLGATVLPLCWGLITLRRTLLRSSGRLPDLLRINAAGLLVGIPLSLVVLLSSNENAVMGSFVVVQIAMLCAYLLLGRERKVI